MTMSKWLAGILLVASVMFLAACGGGSSSGVRETPPGQTGTLQPGQPDPEAAIAALRDAAMAIPNLGRRSVTQSSQADANNVTTDIAEGVFDRGHMNLTVTGRDGTQLTLDSGENAVDSGNGTPVRNNQTARNWLLELVSSDGITTARVFGEVPAGEFPLRAIHASGNWATNRHPVVTDWEAGDRSGPIIPADHIEYLRSLNVNWVGLSVALHYEDSMDSTVERVTSSDVVNPSFSDDAIRQMVREFKENGIDVYLTLAFESVEAESADRPVRRWQLGDPGDPVTGVPPDDPSVFGRIAPEYWPWNPDHPDHERIVAEFWETYTAEAVHLARIAEEEGVRMFSLGTETERLFRTRSGGYWPNHFRGELETLVSSVREVYSGLLTYDMHYSALTDADHFGVGSRHLWGDLNLDVVGLSAWFPLVDSAPSTVMSVESLEERYEQIFRDYLVPLARQNPGRRVVYLEYGTTDNVGSPAVPAGQDSHFRRFEFSDADGNGLDDGQETQANMYQALLNTMARYPGVLNGVFWWDNWIASDEEWAKFPVTQRGFPIREKLSEDVVRSTYESWGDWLTGGYWMHVKENGDVAATGAFVDAPELAGAPSLPSLGTATYRGRATGGYALVYGSDVANVAAGSHEIGDYEGQLELVADFERSLVSGRVHSIEVNGLRTPLAGGTRPFNDVAVGYEISLEAATFDRDGFTGDTSVTSTDSGLGIADSSGSWGGKFSTVPDLDGNPRLVAGTHGAEFTSAGGTEAAFIGAFAGVTGR